MMSIAVICEAPTDRETAGRLADQVICCHVDWIEPDVIDSYREFRGYRRSDPQLHWKDVKTLAKAQGVVVAGFINGLPAAPDAHNAQRALRLLDMSPDRPDGVMLIRDADDELQRRTGLEQARTHSTVEMPVVIGCALSKRECWHLAGFEPETDAERTTLDELSRELGFDPRLRSEELTAKHDEANDKKSAKRVLTSLTGGERDREYRCLELPPDTLIDRGKNNGLAEFLTEIRTRLVPLFGGPPPEQNRPNRSNSR